MNTANIATDKKNKLFIIILLSVAITIAITSSIPVVQNSLKQIFSTNSRQILAKINSFYGVNQTELLILKIKDSYGIQIEIYEVKNKNQQIFKQKFDLVQDSDAYITIDKNTTNLALSDVDKDGQLDILAPSVDRNGNLRLNTFRFNSDLNSFSPLVEIKN